MPLVTFTVTRSASYSNYIDFTSQTGSPSFTMGPDAGTVQLNLPEGTTYTLSGRSDQSSNVTWRKDSPTQVGLEDDGITDNDYDDLMVSIDYGEFNYVSGNQVTYTAETVSIYSFTVTPSIRSRYVFAVLNWSWSPNVISASITPQISNPSVVNPINGTTFTNDVTNLTFGRTISSAVGPTTYTLTVTGPGGSTTSQNITATVVSGASIQTFTATPSVIFNGNVSRLAWTTAAATTVSILNQGFGSVSPVDSGFIDVFPTVTTTYILEANSSIPGDSGESRFVTVYVYEVPTSTFTASRNNIISGTPVTLGWDSTNATFVGISDGTTTTTGLAVDRNDYQVTPTTNTTYTLSVSNLGSITPVTYTQTITVFGSPTSTFTASRNNIISGTNVILSWDSTNATLVTISDGTSTIEVDADNPSDIRGDATGYVTPALTQNTTYTLSVSNPGSITPVTYTQTISILGAPTSTFTASRNNIISGTPVTLGWDSTNADSVTISDGTTTTTGLAVDRNDYSVTPTTNTTYTLSVSNSGSITPVTYTQTITVYPAPTSTFTASRNSIILGQEAVTLGWDSTNATIVSISDGTTTTAVAVDNPSYQVTPTTIPQTTYTLSVSNPGSITPVTYTQVIDVVAYSTPVIDSFTVNDSAGNTIDGINNIITIVRGTGISLKWNTTHATNVIINSDFTGTNVSRDPDGPPNGFTINANEINNSETSLTFILLAFNPLYPATSLSPKAIRIVKIVPPPTFDSLYASSTSINSGNSVTLFWTTSGVSQVTINGQTSIGGIQISNGVGGSSITIANIVSNTTYNFSGTSVSPGISPATGSISITVNSLPPTPAGAFSQRYTTNTTVNIPVQATNVRVSVAGAAGGIGGFDGVWGGAGGAGRIGVFSFSNNVARTLKFTIGGSGEGGSVAGSIINRGGVGGAGGGANGGPSGPYLRAGGGGGGGGASSVSAVINGSDVLYIVAGGGGGGGGSSYSDVQSNTGGAGGIAGDWSVTSLAINSGGIGSTNQTVGFDGGGGGGGGGGVQGGGSGAVGANITRYGEFTHWFVDTSNPKQDGIDPGNQVTIDTWQSLGLIGSPGETPITANAPSYLYASDTNTVGINLSADFRNTSASGFATGVIKEGFKMYYADWQVPFNSSNFTVSCRVVCNSSASGLAVGGNFIFITDNPSNSRTRIQTAKLYPQADGSQIEGRGFCRRFSITAVDNSSSNVAGGGGGGTSGYRLDTTGDWIITNTENNTNTGSGYIDLYYDLTPPPSIDSFSADPVAIRRGNSSTLSWQTTNATSVSISDGTTTTTGLAVDRTDYSVTPTTTTTYILTASGYTGDPVTRSIIVTVYQPGNITVTLDKPDIVAGESTILRWNTTGDVNVITWSSGGITNANVSSNETVSPTVTTIYTATVSGNGASDTESVTLTVYQRPVVTAFSADPVAIRRGVSSRLSWAITNATSASINNGVGAVTVPNGFVDVSPTNSETQYVLSVVGQGNTTASANTTVTVYQPGNITVTLDKPDIVAGQSTTLRWSTTGDVNVITWSSGGITNANLSSNQTVSPTVTTIYTATVSGNGASDTESVTLTVYQIPVVTGFTADPVAIRRGNSSTLSWSTTNATSASINNGVGAVDLNSSISVSPTTTTQYVLSLVGLGNTTGSANTIVTVYQPGNLTLTLDRNAIVAGESTTLRWSTTGDVNVITWSSGGITNGNVSSNQTVSPTVTTIYTATVSGNGASDTESVTLTVYQIPVVTGFTADPVAIRRGLSTRLSWSTTYATSASINNGVGAVTVPNGFVDVSPTTTTQYVLSVFGEGNTTASANTTVTVYQPPTVDTFTASSASIIRGNLVTLAWETSNSTNRAITPQIPNFTIIPEDGSKEVSPTTTTTYRLTVTGLGSDPNVSVYKEVTIIVYQPPVLTLTLDANSITAGNSTTLRWSITGDADNITWSSGGITNTNLSSYELVNPTITTTYTATISGLGGSDTKTVTLLVYQIPTVSLTVPTSLLYGEQGTITYSSCYSNISLTLNTTYVYLNPLTGELISSIPMGLPLSRPNSAEIGVGTTCVNDQTTPTVIPYNTVGPFFVRYTIVAVGDGGTKTSTVQSITIIIDQTPENINIPPTGGLAKSQDPIYTPGPISSIILSVTDIDIPVEVKSNKPIKAEINDSNVFKDLRSI